MGSVLATASASLMASARQIHRVAQRVARGQPAAAQLVRAHVELAAASHTSQANAAVIRTADETLGTVIDLLA